jgi:hypothetical protein
MAMKMTPTRQKWFDLLARWEASGLDAAAFAASEGEAVTEQRLQRWKWKAKKLQGGKEKQGFIRLEPKRATEAVMVKGLEVVTARGLLVRVPMGFDAETLTRLLVIVDGGGR